MCKFCEGKETLGREDHRIFMNEYGQLVYLGEHTIFGDVIGNIKFCPECGKAIKFNNVEVTPVEPVEDGDPEDEEYYDNYEEDEDDEY